jgi:hypothetical protein
MTKVPSRPSGRYIGEVGASPNRRPGYGLPKDQESPQAPEDKRGPGYANIVSTKTWLRGPDSTKMPHFQKTTFKR